MLKRDRSPGCDLKVRRMFSAFLSVPSSSTSSNSMATNSPYGLQRSTERNNLLNDPQHSDRKGKQKQEVHDELEEADWRKTEVLRHRHGPGTLGSGY